MRLATAEDAAEIANVHVASWHETYKGIIPNSYLKTLSVADKQQMWERAIGNGHSVYLAESNNQIIGFANGGKIRDLKPPYLAEIFTLYLLKKYHRQGIGKQLFESIKQQFLSKNLSCFVTWVLADNPTLGFYLHMGAKIIDERIEDFDGIKLKELQLGWQ